MECVWRLFRHRRSYGYRYQPHPPVFYLHIPAHNGISYYYLYDTGILEKHEKVCKSGTKKSLVLFIKRPLSDFPQKGKPPTHNPRFSKSLMYLEFSLLPSFFKRFFKPTILTQMIVCCDAPFIVLFVIRRPHLLSFYEREGWCCITSPNDVTSTSASYL